MLRRLLSYFIPVNIHKQPSALSKTLEVTWANGQLVLDSRHTNYSFGSLQRVLRKGLLEIGFEKIRGMSEILVLGVAGGSVIQTINGEAGFTGRITGVEIDPEVIALSKKFFGLDRIPNLELINDDAFEFVLRTRQQYDLVIIDIFQDTTMPGFLFETYFVNRLGEITSQNGIVVFNTMTLKESDFLRNSEFKRHVDTKVFNIRSLPRLESHNELMILEKPKNTSSAENKRS